ncbi:hypothetical protein GU926_17955 [Nibribacter ruber]|uniref:Uncharacterized protein n=1 Tax=Nibribacter ruber TaxID=2698458 RepID=A0A6P1P494_9BACT|nr:hypothetical protein [Nibribacter ruber]QHL89212.1 hypothetical protein GU926_17955 [Nibribacter ruber]
MKTIILVFSLFSGKEAKNEKETNPLRAMSNPEMRADTNGACAKVNN